MQHDKPRVRAPQRMACTYKRAWVQGVNHHYTREERERLANVESIDYLPPNSEVYRRWLAGQPHRCLALSHAQ